ncbi:helix-turn-helix domain-containing protein [uncultured Methylophaga sp.]|jgi:excisionase family DNA binding protein|uniref:helix-turn-helix transcriptional regulator n=1 Tax=uncultured Methylophaga sp. TaxID=285271 RepID=UPI0030D7ED13|tara:strand:+ start:8260 stop:8472 length:213 start_codon:yes stop_codon:yes gene_type:complete
MTIGQLLNSQQAADYLGVSKAFLERDRWAGARIPFIKIGSRAVRYRTADLESYIEQQVRLSTSQTSVLEG